MAVADGAAYFVTSSIPFTSGALGIAATVIALRTTDGSVLWEFSLPNSSNDESYLSSVVDGTVYVVASAYGRPATFYALSATDGHVLWQVHPYIIRRVNSLGIWSAATVADGVVYLPVQAQDGLQHLLALRATDGSQLWDFRAPACGEPRLPAVDNGMVYLSCGLIKGDLYGVRASDGILVWHRGSLGWYPSAPVAANGLVYVNGTGGCGPVDNPPCPPVAFYALDEQTGAVRWQVPQCSGGDFVMLSDGVLYCNGYFDGQFGLSALDPSTGAVRLRYSLATISALGRLDLYDPAIAGGVICYVGDERVNAFAAATGALLWQSPTLVNYTNLTTATIFVVPQA
jgi:outer membrane protein assembly factor BamB